MEISSNVYWLIFIAAQLIAQCKSIDPQLLKPCFERYDNHKLFGAAPIHSEWRMNSEEECLPFCIRAASRCASIVYDKQEQTCYYFSVNGIEMETIERNARMVYLQVAERRCVDDMLMVMESEDAQTQEITVSRIDDKVGEELRYIVQQYPKVVKKTEPSKILYGKVEATMNIPVQYTTPESISATTLKTDTIAVTETATTLLKMEQHSAENIFHKEENDGDKIYDDLELHNPNAYAQINPTTKITSTTSTITTTPLKTTIPITEPDDVTGKQNLEGLQDNTNKDTRPLQSKLYKYGLKAGKPPLYFDRNIQSNSNSDTSKKEETNVNSHVNMSASNDILPQNPIIAINSAVDSFPSLLPIMSGFKAIQRHNSTAAVAESTEEHVNLFTSNNIRRHPGQSTTIIPSTIRPTMASKIETTSVGVKSASVSVLIDDSNLNRDPVSSNIYGRHIETPFDDFATELAIEEKRFVVPHVERLPPASSEEGFINEKDISANINSQDQENEIGCGESMKNEIWLAVESAKLRSSLRARNMNYLTRSEPGDCIRECSNNADKTTQKRRCDAFTYLEGSKQCIFDSVGLTFLDKMAPPAPRPDFSTRAFHRLCFPSNMARFRGCGEFLAFRNYALTIPAREFFNGLPTGVEGVKACLELCVLSSDFQCRSALFDSNSSICQLFDEYSLSAPHSFKEHSRDNQLYFENGCLDVETQCPDLVYSITRK